MMAQAASLARMPRSKISKAAAELGRKGGSVRSEAKAAAVRANGKLGGRPVRLHEVAGEAIHAEAQAAGRIEGRPAFRALTPSAARWLARHGFEHAEPGARPVLWIRRPSKAGGSQA